MWSTRLRSMGAVLVLGLAALACTDGGAPPQPAQPPQPATPPAQPGQPVADAPAGDTPAKAPPTTPPAVKPAPAPARPALETIPTGQVQALVDRWLAAQNTGDFDAYAATYADKFFGVKRSGPRTYRFDRAGWVKDRRRMFRKPMKVSLAKARISAGPSSARVAFEQTWSSGSYSDVGPKQLVVVKTPQGLRIAREEMLQSTLRGAAPLAQQGPPTRFAVVYDAAYVVLGEVDAAGGAPRTIKRGGPAVVRAPARAADAGEWVGQVFELFGEQRVCRGRVEAVQVLGRVIPHFGAVQTWNGEMDDNGPMSEAEVAEAIWALTDYDGGRLLVGRLDTSAAECAGALWARPAGNAPPVSWTSAKPSPAEEAALLRALRAGAGWQGKQTEFMSQNGKGAGPWDAGQSVKRDLSVWRRPGGATYMVASVDAGLGCGQFGGALWQVFRWSKGRAVPVFEATGDTTPFSLRAVVDLDGDGQPELIGLEDLSRDEVILRLGGDGPEPVRQLDVADLDCPC